MSQTTDLPSRLLLPLAVGLGAILCGYLAYRTATRGVGARSQPPPRPAAWVAPPEAAKDPPARATPQEPDREPARALALPFALDAARPLRITWPLDVGPDISPDRKDSRLCLRARQGANEFLTTGAGDALYAFRLAEAAKCRTWFRMRYCDDGVGEVECNNTFLVTFDDQPARLIGNDNTRTEWAWRRGPAVALDAGLHWLRVDLREDGPLMDRVAIVAEGAPSTPQALDALEPVALPGLAGERPPLDPQRPIQEVELFALPTHSLVVGAGHVNEITLCASWQGMRGPGFEGTIDIQCATAPELAANGQRAIACRPAAPFARNVVGLAFPPNAPRRTHKVAVTVVDKSGSIVFREELEFLKGYAWAFLGPFKDQQGRTRPETGSTVDAALACERSPMLLARMQKLEALGLAGAAPAQGHPRCEWKIVADGSCYDWTGVVDLRKVYGPIEAAFAYAVTWLQSATSTSRRMFSFQADDAGWLWMNGCFLVQLPVDLPREANRLWTSGPLRHGPNPVVVKLTQASYYWGFGLGVVHWQWHARRRWGAITGIEPDQWPRRN